MHAINHVFEDSKLITHWIYIHTKDYTPAFDAKGAKRQTKFPSAQQAFIVAFSLLCWFLRPPNLLFWFPLTALIVENLKTDNNCLAPISRQTKLTTSW